MQQAIQVGLSLAAILALFAFARYLRLGGEDRLDSDEEARRLAEEAIDGFQAKNVVLDRGGMAALLEDDDGRIMLLRKHGTHHAARMLDEAASARREGDRLTVSVSDRRFGATTLDIGAAGDAWAQRIEQL